MKTLTPRQINIARRKEGKPPLNFKLLRRIIAKIETTPEAYDQSIWGRRNDNAPCGTAACIAGWACFLDRKKTRKQLWRNPRSAATVGIKILGLDKGDDWTDGEEGMFDGYADSWPDPFRGRFQNAGSQKQQARVAVAYLKHVIKTGQVVR